MAAPDYTKVPKLPGEVGRMDTQFTKIGTPYQVIDVLVSGDRSRLFVPHSAPPNKWVWVPFVWFYHANGSSYASLSTAFKTGAEGIVDNGGVSICPNYGGSDAWVSPVAVNAQTAVVNWVNSLWRVYYSFGRANSGGGAMMCWAFGNKMLPRQIGMYMASSVYDVNDVYTRGPDRVGPAYKYDEALMQSTNPATLPQSAWSGLRLRASYNPDDTVVPPQQHGLALAALAQPVATEVTLLQHDGGNTTTGHWVPPTTNNDMLATFKRWANL